MPAGGIAISACVMVRPASANLSSQHYARWFDLQAYFRAPVPFAADVGRSLAARPSSIPRQSSIRPGVLHRTSILTGISCAPSRSTPGCRSRPRSRKARRQAEAHRRPTKVEAPAVHRGKRRPDLCVRRDAVGRGRDDLCPERVEAPDPTDLIIIDEADRLKTASLEQVRDIFDHGKLGVLFIGMLDVEKRFPLPTTLFPGGLRPCVSSAECGPSARPPPAASGSPAGVTLPAERYRG